MIFCFCFYLYNLPVSAVLYPFIICLTVGIIAFLFSFSNAKKRKEAFLQINDTLFEGLPKTNDTDDEEYRKIVLSLREAIEKIQTENLKKYSDTIEYYTLWVHQIKTPIAAMKLKLQNEDNDLSRQLLNELNRIEQYVEMVLTYLKLDTDSTDFVFRQHELDGIIRQCVRRFSGEFIERKLKLDFKKTNISVLSDEKWLCFVIEQILSNALKYTNNGTISIYAENKMLFISDTGIGIEKEDLPRIFENGFTGFNGRTDKKASGIGLYISKRICENLGHGIYARSQIGVGTTIIIDFNNRDIEIE